MEFSLSMCGWNIMILWILIIFFEPRNRNWKFEFLFEAVSETLWFQLVHRFPHLWSLIWSGNWYQKFDINVSYNQKVNHCQKSFDLKLIDRISLYKKSIGQPLLTRLLSFNSFFLFQSSVDGPFTVYITLTIHIF